MPVRVWISGGLALARCMAAPSPGPGWPAGHMQPGQASPPTAAAGGRQSPAEKSSASQRSPASLLLHTIVGWKVVGPGMGSRGCSAQNKHPESSISSVTLGSSPDPPAVVSLSVRCPGRSQPFFPGLLQESHQEPHSTHWEPHSARQQGGSVSLGRRPGKSPSSGGPPSFPWGSLWDVEPARLTSVYFPQFLTVEGGSYAL